MIIRLFFVFSLFSFALRGEDTRLQSQYEFACQNPSDINEHVSVLRSLAMECASVVEIGVRSMVSSWGLLQGLSENPRAFRSYLGIDLALPPLETFSLAKELAEEIGVSFKFLQANDLDIDIESTELLFIDSLHTYCHLTYELEKFSPKVTKYIAMHDTGPTWENKDDFYTGDYSEYPAGCDRTKKGLPQAVRDFLSRHPEWTVHEWRMNNYGFTILKRIEKPKIYDCFMFFNELEVLEIKLNELYDHVDYFVLVESAETFRGAPKPLYFAENKHHFSKFLDKIIHVIVSEHFETNNPWDREYYQRNQIARGLTNAQDDDFVIIEDLDEIISAAALPEFIDALQTLRYVTCEHHIYTYYLNRYGHPGNIFSMLGSIVTRYSDVKSLSPQGIRNRMDKTTAIKAGWHFTYMGGVERVRKKLESFSHYELDNEAYKDYARIRQDAESLKLVEIDESYPQFVRDNISYFEKLGFIDL